LTKRAIKAALEAGSQLASDHEGRHNSNQVIKWIGVGGAGLFIALEGLGPVLGLAGRPGLEVIGLCLTLAGVGGGFYTATRGQDKRGEVELKTKELEAVATAEAQAAAKVLLDSPRLTDLNVARYIAALVDAQARGTRESDPEPEEEEEAPRPNMRLRVTGAPRVAAAFKRIDEALVDAEARGTRESLLEPTGAPPALVAAGEEGSPSSPSSAAPLGECESIPGIGGLFLDDPLSAPLEEEGELAEGVKGERLSPKGRPRV
jgi:hypothetical protein